MLAGGVVVADREVGSGGDAVGIRQEGIRGGSGWHHPLCQPEQDHHLDVEPWCLLDPEDLDTPAGTALASDRMPKFGDQRPTEAGEGGVRFDVVQQGEAIHDRCRRFECQQLLCRPECTSGIASEVPPDQAVRQSAAGRPGTGAGDATKVPVESGDEGDESSALFRIAFETVHEPLPLVGASLLVALRLELGGQAFESQGPVLEAADHTCPAGESTPGAVRHEVVVGIPEGCGGEERLEVGSSEAAIRQGECAQEESRGDGLVEASDRRAVEGDPGCPESLVEEAGVVAAWWVDYRYPGEVGTGPGCLEDLSDGDPRLLLLVGDRYHQPTGPGARFRRARQVGSEQTGEGLGVGVGLSVCVAADDGERRGGGQRRQESPLGGEQVPGEMDDERRDGCRAGTDP